MKFLVLFVCFTTLFFNKIRYGTILTIPSIMTMIWYISLYFALLGLYDIYVPDNIVAIYTIIFITSFNFFAFFFSLFYKKTKSKQVKEKNYLEYELKDNKIKINKNKLTYILFICLILLIIVCHKGVSVFIETRNFNSVRNAFINYESIGMHTQVFLTTTIVPFGVSACMLSIVDYVYNKKFNSSLIMSTLFIIAYVLLTGGREYLLSLILTFAIALYIKNSGAILQIFKNNKKIIRMCFLVLILILFITSQRSFKGYNFFTSIYVYFSGCFCLFGVYLKNGMISNYPPLYGQSLISGFSFVFIEILRFFTNTNILPGNYYLEMEATGKYIPISSNIAMNATPTTMYYALRDFGVYGLIIYPLVISYFYNKLKKNNLKNKNILTETIFIHFVRTSVFLSLSYRFGSFKNISFFLYIFIICKICNVNDVKQDLNRTNKLEVIQNEHIK